MTTTHDPIATKQENRTAFDGQAAGAKAQGIEVPAADLVRYLEAQDGVDGAAAVRDVSVPDGAGASNGILFFTADVTSGRRTETEHLVLRYETDAPLIKQKRFQDEYATLRAVMAAGLPSPVARWEDADGDLLGRPSYVTERLVGACPPSSVFTDGILLDASPEDRKRMMLDVVRYHGRLHAANVGPEAVPHLTRRGQGTTAIDRELSWWLEEARLAEPPAETLERLKAAHVRLAAAQPDPYRERLVHGDAQFANHVFDGGEIVAVLDWELAFLGHNESDLALLVLFADALNPAEAPIPGVPTEAEFVAAYEAEAGRPVAAWEYFQAFNLMKVATAMVFGARTMPGADQLFLHYAGLLEAALDRVPGA